MLNLHQGGMLGTTYHKDSVPEAGELPYRVVSTLYQFCVVWIVGGGAREVSRDDPYHCRGGRDHV